MSGLDLPQEVRDLIQSSVPSVDVLEMLIFLARHPGREMQAREISDQLDPAVITEHAVTEHLAFLKVQGLVAENLGGFAYAPTAPALEAAVSALIKAYNERPVTLIRTVYAIAANKRIQMLADAFKIKKD